MDDTLHQRLAALRRKHSEEKLAKEKREEFLAKTKPKALAGASRNGAARGKTGAGIAVSVGYIDPREMMKKPGQIKEYGDEKMEDGAGQAAENEKEKTDVEMMDQEKEGEPKEEEEVQEKVRAEERKVDKGKGGEQIGNSGDGGERRIIQDAFVFRAPPANNNDDDDDSDRDAKSEDDEDDGNSTSSRVRQDAKGAQSFIYQGGSILSDAETTAATEMAIAANDDREQQRIREREEESIMEKRFLALASGIRKEQQQHGGVLGSRAPLSAADELKERFKRVFEGRGVAGSSTGAVRGGSEFSHDIGVEVDDGDDPDISVCLPFPTS